MVTTMVTATVALVPMSIGRYVKKWALHFKFDLNHVENSIETGPMYLHVMSEPPQASKDGAVLDPTVDCLMSSFFSPDQTEQLSWDPLNLHKNCLISVV